MYIYWGGQVGGKGKRREAFVKVFLMSVEGQLGRMGGKLLWTRARVVGEAAVNDKKGLKVEQSQSGKNEIIIKGEKLRRKRRWWNE